MLKYLQIDIKMNIDEKLKKVSWNNYLSVEIQMNKRNILMMAEVFEEGYPGV
jgi:hypothetical protein